MSSVGIQINDIDYDSLFGGFETLSNNTTSPTTENDTDSRISDTPPMMGELNNNFDIWPWTMDSPLSDDPNGENYDLNALINDQNPLLLADALTDSDNSTLDDLLAAFELPEQQNPETLQQIPSLSPPSIQNPYLSPPSSSNIVPSTPPILAQRPLILPKPITTSSVNQTNFPLQQQQQITNCVKLQSYSGTASTGGKCVKIEPVINTTPPSLPPPPTNITIITTSKPITVAKVPMIKMPLTSTATPITIVKTEADTVTTNVKRIATVYPNNTNTNTDNSSLTTGSLLKTFNGNNSMTSPPAKRQRSESSTNHHQLSIQSSEITTLTLDQLKVQYGNVSEEALKKHLRMIKNRESASLSRKRRKQLMENLEVKVKDLSDENEQLRSENTKLLTRIHTLEMENDLLKTYKIGNGITSPRARKPLILMGIVLLVVFNIFTLKSLSPISNDQSNSVALYNGYNGEGTIVRGRTILSARRSSNDDSYVASSEHDDSAGMQILLFSDVAGKKELRGWHRVGHHINYAEYKQRTYNPLLERDINYFELDFQLEFPHTSDTCYIAHCYPYTFSDLKDDLDYLSSIRSQEIFRRDILCESQAGNSCFIVTVTDESVPISQKKFVFITARIHPGETNSSYMMRGVLEFITSDDRVAQKLRSQLVFKIIPMLNPDGVIIGNYRCSLTGKDMNRNFRHPRKQTFPTIYHMKQLMQDLQKEEHEILAFCDLHGHSRKSNVFAYGCDGCDGPQPNMKNFLNARILPYIMSRTAPEMFAFDYCKFHIHRCKESTGRVVMWKEMLIRNSFTLEASFAGSSIVYVLPILNNYNKYIKQKNFYTYYREKPCHFNIQDYEKFGQCICQSLRQYLDILCDSTRLDSIFLDITKSVLRKLGKEKIPPALLPAVYPEEKQTDEPQISITSVASCLQVLSQCHDTINEQDASSSSDSDSDPEGGELPDIPYRKEDQSLKKKLKKKRSEKIIEERVQRIAHKREANEESNGISGTNGTNGTNSTNGINDTNRRIRVSYPYTSEIDMNSQLKLTLAVDQMDKATRTLPPRGTLFTSKYANRSGHGLPIFTTERALERRQVKLF
ncbi:unnamed protein product [Rotaria sp. Silwood2]|nr:unnamed protein product [Rotaria sp. Silwood2]